MEIKKSRQLVVELQLDVYEWITICQRCALPPLFTQKFSQISHRWLPELRENAADYNQFSRSFDLFMREARSFVTFWRGQLGPVFVAFCNLMLLKIKKTEQKIAILIV
ncbi:TPA: hypothetical protein DF272_01615 [Candidatus Falkowbacteria bacterium]|nr:hypothetical protein [Candidatus Falkowbacteria bacterium]